MNNDIFSFRRFGLLLKKDIQENWKKYLMYILIMYGVVALYLIFLTNPYRQYEGHEIYQNKGLIEGTTVIFILFSIISASIMMLPINNKPNSISYLKIPASTLDKFMSRWLIVTVGYIIAFLLIIWFVDLTRVLFCSVWYSEYNNIVFIDFSKIVGMKEIIFSDHSVTNEYASTPKKFTLYVSIYLLLQSVAALGSTFCPKNSFIKTFSAGLIILGLYMLTCRIATFFFLEKGFDDLGYVLDAAIYNKMGEKEDIFILFSAIFLIFTLINWILAYYTFRKTEIIRRW
ncbi:MAG: hypothetical protein LBV43_05770 [Prevotella sp.]|jgi:hypothetical protein|nr:hypothetical protein [Prevotella sp.]